jgi:hypothetical protein
MVLAPLKKIKPKLEGKVSKVQQEELGEEEKKVIESDKA